MPCVGVCTDMCPRGGEVGWEQRSLEVRGLHRFELPDPRRPDLAISHLAIKPFRRSAADKKLDIPEEVRTPEALQRTLRYCEDQIYDADQSPDPRFDGLAPTTQDTYIFLMDRTRMIRKDFILQNFRGGSGNRHDPLAIDVFERLTRYYIMMGHEMSGTELWEKAGYGKQNTEAVNESLSNLDDFYEATIDSACEVGSSTSEVAVSAHEAEFRAYYIVFFADEEGGGRVIEYLRRLIKRRRAVYYSRDVQAALGALSARSAGDYCNFFRRLRSAPYLAACLLARSVPAVRAEGLEAMRAAYGIRGGQGFPLTSMADNFGMCGDDEAFQ